MATCTRTSYRVFIVSRKLYSQKGAEFAGPWNFGPSSRQNMKVIKLAKIIKKKLNSKSKIIIKIDKRFQNRKFKNF